MRRAPLAAIALAAALAGCGEDEERSTGSVTIGQNATVRVEGDEYSFKPGTIVVNSRGRPAEFTVRLENVGALPHDLHVRQGDDERGGTDAIGDGETTEKRFTLPKGDYEMYCSIGDHAELGMKGKLSIR